MKISTPITAAAAAAVAAAAVVGAGAFMLPASASARTTTHTLQFIAEIKASVDFSSSTGAEQDTDVNSSGKVVGYDMLYFVVSRTTAALNITVDVNGGVLYGTATLNSNGVVSNGKVTGGTGAFKGTAGTFTVKSLGKAGTRKAVKVTYHK